MTGDEVLIALAVFLLAGVAKGLIGIGFPTVTISLLVTMLEPRQAIILTLGPILVLNIWQSYRAGEVARTLRQYAPFAICLCGFLLGAAQFSQGISTRALSFAIGISVSIFALVQLFLHPPELPKKYDVPAQIVAGTIAGIMGGLTAIWGPPVLIYLIARRTPKDEFIRAIGVLLTLGTIPLLYSYWSSGILVGNKIWLTVFMTIPAIFGFAIGEKFRGRLSGEAFQKTVLVMFFLLGLNILRRAVMLG